jgi:predicted nucleic-acid-binding protein
VERRAYVLTSVYGIVREVVVDHLITLLRKENIRPCHLPKGLAIEALLLCRPSHRVSFADALIWAAARADSAAVFTLDERFPSEGITVLRSALT